LPGEEEALNFDFATRHDSAHLLAGYDTSPRGELLVSTFTAAMHRKEAMSGHVLPVIFSWHLGIALNELAGAAKGALDPQEFWHAWARGEQMKVDLFGPEWDFWAATREPIETVRSRIGVTA
jgi:ubiquinone biosynthesis protein Coq4